MDSTQNNLNGLTYSQISYLSSQMLKVIPEKHSYEKGWEFGDAWEEVITEKQYKKLFALSYNKNKQELLQMIDDINNLAKFKEKI